jgi:hypothetical protein
MEGKVALICAQLEDLAMREIDPTFSWSKRRAPRRPPRQRHRLVKRPLVAPFGPAKQLGHLAKAAAQTRESDPARPVVVIADGAAWIKQEQGRHFPQATCLLDWAHLWRQVRHAILTAARAKGLSTSGGDYQLFWHRTHLWQGNVEQGLEGLRRLSTDLPAEALKPAREAMGYLEHQRPWMSSSEHWTAKGYPVGSGMLERAVAIVLNRRMKKRGMRWCRANATAVAALRTDLLNDDWITPQRLRAFP